MILQGKCTSPLYRYAADGADVQIVDPPYSPKVHKKATSCGMGGFGKPGLMGVRKRDLGFGHLTPALMLRIAWYASRVRRWSVVFTDIESVSTWIAAMRLHGVEYVRTVPWVRWSQPQLSGDRPPTGAEAICIFHAPRANQGGGKMRWNGPGGRVAYRSEDASTEDVARAEYLAKSLRGKDKYSCEKPLDLMLALVSDYSEPGETVFDPCAGMGTTLLAARLLGREAFGLELTAAVAEAADLRAMPSTGLSERDEERACRWILETREEASSVPAPKAANKSDVKTWERAQRRLADAERLIKYGNQ
jgi:site-specific DNA-methyltransferase (adenine-specific)